MRRCIVLLLAGLAWSAQAKHADPPLDAVTLDVPSPHVTWAKPLRGGPIRALFIAPEETLRDAAELAQRLDLVFDTFPVRGGNGLSASEALLLRRLDGRPDVILLAHCNPDELPRAAQARLIERVQQGAGLITAYLSPESETAPQQGVPLVRGFLRDLAWANDQGDITRGVGEFLGASSPNLHAMTRRAAAGKGRLVEFVYPPGDRPVSHCLIPPPLDSMNALSAHFDNAMSFVCRALRWAAHRDVPVRIAGVADLAPQGPVSEEIPPGYPKEFVAQMRDSAMRQPTRPYLIQLSQPADREYRVAVQVRRPDAPTQLAYTCKTPLAKGASTYAVDLLVGPGEYFLDMWIQDKKGVADWFTETIQVPGWPVFESVECAKNYLLPNDTLEITAKVRPIFNPDRICTVYARAIDPLLAPGTPAGRVVAEAQGPAPKDGAPVRLRLSFADLMASLVKLEVFALEGDAKRVAEWELNCADRDSRYLTVRMPQREPGFSFTATAQAPEEYNNRFYLHRLSDLGVDSVCAPASEAALFHCAQLGLRYIPEFNLLSRDTSAGPMPFPGDPGFRAREGRQLAEETTRYWAGGAGTYLLGGNYAACLQDPQTILSEESLGAFREAMREQYRDIAALEAAWGATYASWDDVTHVDERDARLRNRFAPSVDFWTCLDNVFTQYCAFARQQIQSVDRNARVGLETGPDDATAPYHWRALARELDFFRVPATARADFAKLSDFRKPGALVASLMNAPQAKPGATPEPEGPAGGRWLPWHAVLHQADALWYRNACGSENPLSALAADGRPTPFFRETARVVGELKAGLAPLLLSAQRLSSGVAILDSRPSRRLGDIEFRFKTPVDAQADLVAALDRLGYEYRFIDSTDLSRKLNGIRVLFLTSARALSDAEVGALRAFAGQGGCLIADVAPGVYNEHGVPRGTPPLDDLFGVRHGDAAAPVTGDADVSLDAGKPVKATLDRVQADVSTQESGAAAMGRMKAVPLWLRVPGKPHLLLNHTLPAWQENPHGIELLDALLRQAGTSPAFDVRTRKDRPFQGERMRFRFGGAEIFAVLADPQAKEQRIRMPFSKRDIVYDLREGRRLSKPHKASFTLAPGDARCFALLPGRVTGLGILTPGGIAAGKRLPIQIAVSTGAEWPGDHLVCIDLLPKKGQPIPHYRRIVRCEKGVGQTFLPLALNEAPGHYLIRARDVLTGFEETRHVGISGKTP